MSSVQTAISFLDAATGNMSNLTSKEIETAMKFFVEHMDNSTVVSKGLLLFQLKMIEEFINGSHVFSEQLGNLGYANILTILLNAPGNNNTILCLQGFAVLGAFEGNVPTIVNSGAVEAEVSCVEMNRAKLDVIEFAFSPIQSILTLSVEARQRFLACGGIEATIAAMNAHGDSERVQALGARVLANCTIETPLARERILQCKGIDTIIWGMQLHKKSEIVQISGCNSLGTVAIRNKMEPIFNRGGVDVIIQALSLHPSSTEVQKNAVYALGNITSSNKKYVQKIISKGSVEAILSAMKRHETVKEVVFTACYSLSWIFSRQDIYEEYFTPDIRRAVEATLVVFHSDKSLSQRVDSLLRIEDPRAALARAQDVCSGVYIKRCGRPNCGTLKKYYCEECCAPQWAYECHTCSKEGENLPKYCVACWKKYHKGHHGIKVFITTVCGHVLESLEE